MPSLCSTERLRIMHGNEGSPAVSQTLKAACILQYRDMPKRASGKCPASRAPSPIQEGSIAETDEKDENTNSALSNKVIINSYSHSNGRMKLSEFELLFVECI